MPKAFLRALAVALTAQTLVPSSLIAQVDRATLSGRVLDASGAAVPGATVEATAIATGQVRKVVADERGAYRIPGLAHGGYMVTGAQEAFQTALYTDVQLEVGQVRALDILLQVGAVTSSVSVMAEATPLDTRTAEIGAAVTSRQIEALPLNGRNWASMMAFAPGAVNTGEGSQNNIRFFGRARDDNNWTFDGVDATGVKDPRTEASLRLVMSTEAISEFRVSSTGFTADMGTGAGGQVNVVSKSGTNQWRGGAFQFFRDEVLDERRVLDQLPEEPAFRLNQYGGSLGGPVRRDRTFMFATFEGLRQTLHTANDRPALVPSRAFRAQVQALRPELASVMQAYPLGTSSTSDPSIDQYVGRRQLTWDEDSFLVRLDHRLTDRVSLIGRLNGVKGVIDSEVRSDLLETRRSSSFPMNATGQWQQVLGSASLGELKLGWNRSPLDRVDQGLGAEGYEIRNAFTATRPTLATEEKPQSMSLLGNLVTTRGRHTLKVGGEFRRIHVNVGNGPAVSVRWNSVADFLANRTNRIRVDGELPLQEGRRWYGIGYSQTEWRATDALTVNAGLRYEYYSVMDEASGNGNVLDLERCPPTAASLFCAPGSAFYFPDKNNVAPRLGVAWTLHPRVVVRAGYGIFYSPGQNDDVMAAVDSMAVRGELTTPAAYPVQDDVPAALGLANSRPRSLQRDREDMQAHTYSASAQVDLGADLVATIGYVGSRASNAFNRIFVNTIDPATGRRPAAPFLSTQIDQKGSLGETRYNGMTAAVTRAYRGGLQVQTSYTLGNARDNNAGNGEGSEWQDARCGDCEWGPSDFDIRHSFAGNVVYELPFGAGRPVALDGVADALVGGWNVSAALIGKSGRPINVVMNRTGPDGNDVNQRPNVVPGVIAVTGDTSDWLNNAAFVAPAASEFGNSPRNGFRGPSAWQLDLSLNKAVRIRRTTVDLRVDAFNVFNVDQFGNPARDFGAPLTFGLLSPLNSGPTGTGTARQIQLGLRVGF
jgi:Carboxypeptidase regulatory-like domain/TonB dependent receptor